MSFVSLPGRTPLTGDLPGPERVAAQVRDGPRPTYQDLRELWRACVQAEERLKRARLRFGSAEQHTELLQVLAPAVARPLTKGVRELTVRRGAYERCLSDWQAAVAPLPEDIAKRIMQEVSAALPIAAGRSADEQTSLLSQSPPFSLSLSSSPDNFSDFDGPTEIRSDAETEDDPGSRKVSLGDFPMEFGIPKDVIAQRQATHVIQRETARLHYSLARVRFVPSIFPEAIATAFGGEVKCEQLPMLQLGVPDAPQLEALTPADLSDDVMRGSDALGREFLCARFYHDATQSGGLVVLVCQTTAQTKEAGWQAFNDGRLSLKPFHRGNWRPFLPLKKGGHDVSVISVDVRELLASIAALVKKGRAGEFVLGLPPAAARTSTPPLTPRTACDAPMAETANQAAVAPTYSPPAPEVRETSVAAPKTMRANKLSVAPAHVPPPTTTATSRLPRARDLRRAAQTAAPASQTTSPAAKAGMTKRQQPPVKKPFR